MRRLITLTGCLLTCALAAHGAAQANRKTQTAEDLNRAMKKIAPAQQALSKAIQSMAYADAKKQVEIIEVELQDAQNFWVAKKRDDAIRFTQQTLVKTNALKKLLDSKTPDQGAITTGYRDLGTACLTCHRVYRTTDDNNNFILKPGTVP